MNTARGPRIPRPGMSEARQQGYCNIGDASAATGVSIKMIRHYERIGLLPKASRSFANYRIYSESDLHTLRFIKRARSLGFSIKEIGGLLNLWQDQGRRSSEVKALAEHHVHELDGKIRELQAMRDSLQELANRCHGDHRPDCPILEGLSTPA